MSIAGTSDSSVKISLRLADGELHTLFHHNESGEKTFSLIPAHNVQDTARISIFHSHEPGSKPALLGSILCTNILGDPEKRILNLAVSLTEPNLFSASISHPGGNKPKCIKINLDSRKKKKFSRRNVFKWSGGIIFVFFSLALLFLLISLITRWGSLSATIHPST